MGHVYQKVWLITSNYIKGQLVYFSALTHTRPLCLLYLAGNKPLWYLDVVIFLFIVFTAPFRATGGRVGDNLTDGFFRMLWIIITIAFLPLFFYFLCVFFYWLSQRWVGRLHHIAGLHSTTFWRGGRSPRQPLLCHPSAIKSCWLNLFCAWAFTTRRFVKEQRAISSFPRVCKRKWTEETPALFKRALLNLPEWLKCRRFSQLIKNLHPRVYVKN